MSHSRTWIAPVISCLVILCVVIVILLSQYPALPAATVDGLVQYALYMEHNSIPTLLSQSWITEDEAIHSIYARYPDTQNLSAADLLQFAESKQQTEEIATKTELVSSQLYAPFNEKDTYALEIHHQIPGYSHSYYITFLSFKVSRKGLIEDLQRTVVELAPGGQQ